MEKHVNGIASDTKNKASGQNPRREDRPVYARLPRAPITGSPVPNLTSLYHFDRAGEYGDRSWPGNCGGNLIKDLLLYFRPRAVFDPMSGSGTARDVCRELDLSCVASDIHQDFDACDPGNFPEAETFDFIWAHPPYWRMKLYAEDPAICRGVQRSKTSCDGTANLSGTVPGHSNAVEGLPCSWVITRTAKPDMCPWFITPSAWPLPLGLSRTART